MSRSNQHDGIRVNIRNDRNMSTRNERTRRRPVEPTINFFSQPTTNFSLFSGINPFESIRQFGDVIQIGGSTSPFGSTIIPPTSNYSTYSIPPTLTSTIFPSTYTSYTFPSSEYIESLLRSIHSQDSSLEREASRELDVKESEYVTSVETCSTETSLTETCSICHDELQQGNKVMKLGCKHTFHSECLKEWGKHKPTCPNCRKNIPVKGVNHRFGRMEL